MTSVVTSVVLHAVGASLASLVIHSVLHRMPTKQPDRVVVQQDKSSYSFKGRITSSATDKNSKTRCVDGCVVVFSVSETDRQKVMTNIRFCFGLVCLTVLWQFFLLGGVPLIFHMWPIMSVIWLSCQLVMTWWAWRDSLIKDVQEARKHKRLTKSGDYFTLDEKRHLFVTKLDNLPPRPQVKDLFNREQLIEYFGIDGDIVDPKASRFCWSRSTIELMVQRSETILQACRWQSHRFHEWLDKEAATLKKQYREKKSNMIRLCREVYEQQYDLLQSDPKKKRQTKQIVNQLCDEITGYDEHLDMIDQLIKALKNQQSYHDDTRPMNTLISRAFADLASHIKSAKYKRDFRHVFPSMLLNVTFCLTSFKLKTIVSRRHHNDDEMAFIEQVYLLENQG